MELHYSKSGFANCVFGWPAYKCKNKKIPVDDYISKILEDTKKNKVSIQTELNIGKYLKKIYKKNIIDEYFSLVDYTCSIKSKKSIKKCPLDPKKKYKILYSRNAGCKKITKNSKIFVKNKDNNLKKIDVNNIRTNNIISKNKKYNKSLIVRKCGTLNDSDGYVIKLCFSNENRQNNIRKLLEMIQLLYEANIVQLDIKEGNIVSNSNGDIRLIDFGTSIIASSFNDINVNNDIDDIIYTIFKTKLIGWTYYYLSPEISILLEFYKNKYIEKSTMISILVNKLIKIFGEQYFDNIKYTELINLVDYAFNYKEDFVKQIFLNKTNRQIFKTDIYAAGIVLYDIFKYLLSLQNIELNLHKDEIEQSKDIHPMGHLIDLIYNMSHIDFRNRYDINQCLNNEYFT
jgi:serine/threonine protein kinase